MLPLEYILILLPLVLSTPLFLLVLNPALFFTRPEHATVLVLVLGDVGRSPRMMYHAESLGKLGWRTWVVGYGGMFILQGGAFTARLHRTAGLRWYEQAQNQ